MVHCWQFAHGNPGRKNYHNKEWADKMEKIGLMPSSTGKPGGARTGQRMSDYVLPNKAFIKECEALVNGGFNIPWVDRFSIRNYGLDVKPDLELEPLGLDKDTLIKLTTSIETILGESFASEEVPEPKGRIKSCYQCPFCEIKVWGKPELNLKCTDCDEDLEES